MSNNNEKPSVNGTTDPLQRLASLKAPRDLSLGGAKPNKKVFTPNLNVTRNKNKGPSTSGSRDQKKDDKNKRNNRNDKKNFNKNGPNIIKSSGVFSEGLGSVERRSSRFSYGRDSEPAPALQKPTIRVKDVVKIDKELEEEKIKAAFGETGSDEEAEDFKHALDVEAPVKLPMDDGGPLLDVKPPIDMKEVFEDTNVVNLLKSDQPSLILLQLADSLPGRGGAADEPRRKDQPTTSTDTEEKPVDNRCRLSELEEGRIGSLRVHRSGRVTLKLGDTLFEVCSGTKASFYQEVVSVGVDESSRSANLVSLGPLQHKLNVTPHWESMFQDMAV
ncbi:DNA-directed RNA polymerase III subunit RPC4 isoform X2 [Aricia agestis]|uniref:DNA-directed RNA polymerase III subunit RPC4 isoform X2 n=1 Tax=Aricia agestis TaxID=91739 RepID=UPI001C203FCE|nr:DNA-directed RNA polymerase III subunit RPC4 isoform X2 [Aricia agestis]